MGALHAINAGHRHGVGSNRRLRDRDEVWRAIESCEASGIDRRVADLEGLPAPARRLLERAVPTGSVPTKPIVLTMEGEIKLNRWFPFTARQILQPTRGFVWNASVGWWWLRFRGGDAHWKGRGSLDFRLAGFVPLVRASGTEVDRSAAGRLAIEAVVWAPHALLPQAGASWRPVDDERATVSQLIDGEPHDVTVTVAPDGGLREVYMMRWGNPGGAEYQLLPFGGSVSAIEVFDGHSIATAGTVGWWWGSERQQEGEFFRYRIIDACRAPDSTSHPVR